jgi:hypothetical protein
MYFACSLPLRPIDGQARLSRRKITQIYEGTNQIQRLVMARALLNGLDRRSDAEQRETRIAARLLSFLTLSKPPYWTCRLALWRFSHLQSMPNWHA